jgi:hypothetical protein
MKNILITFIIVTVLLACGSSSKYTDKTSEALDSMIANQSFEIISNSTQPLNTMAMQQLGNAGLLPNGSTAGNIDLSTHTNFLRMKKDSVMAFLPFYGERQFGGGYNNASGIEFEGVPDNLQINKSKQASYEIRFSISDKNSRTDHYNVYIKLYPNLTSNININSSSRSSIQYRGHVQSLDSIQ